MTIETSPISDRHKEYIISGGCPYYKDKVWCNDRGDNTHTPGQHWALYLEPPPSTKVRKIFFVNPKKAIIEEDECTCSSEDYYTAINCLIHGRNKDVGKI